MGRENKTNTNKTGKRGVLSSFLPPPFLRSSPSSSPRAGTRGFYSPLLPKACRLPGPQQSNPFSRAELYLVPRPNWPANCPSPLSLSSPFPLPASLGSLRASAQLSPALFQRLQPGGRKGGPSVLLECDKSQRALSPFLVNKPLSEECHFHSRGPLCLHPARQIQRAPPGCRLGDTWGPRAPGGQCPGPSPRRHLPRRGR